MLNRLFTSRKIFVCLLAMGVTALLGACGGGGGGDPWNYSPPVGTAPTTPIAITTVNSQDVASEAYTSFAVSQSGTAFTSSQAGAPTSPTPVGVQTTSSVSLLDATRKVLEIYNPRQPQIVSGAVMSCDVGTITYPDSEFGIISFNSCDLGGIVFNGQIRFTGTATATSFNGSLTYNNFSVSENDVVLLSIHGQMNIVASYTTGDESGTYSGSLLATTFGDEVIDLVDFDFSYSINGANETTASMTYTVNSTLLGGSVTVATTTPLQYYPGYDHPYAGVIVITGAGDSKVRMTVDGGPNVYGEIYDTVTIDTDSDGDGNYDNGTINRTWAQLTA